MENTQHIYYHFIHHTLKTKYLYIFIGDNNVKINDIQKNPKYKFFDYSQFKKDNIHLINQNIFGLKINLGMCYVAFYLYYSHILHIF